MQECIAKNITTVIICIITNLFFIVLHINAMNWPLLQERQKDRYFIIQKNNQKICVFTKNKSKLRVSKRILATSNTISDMIKDSTHNKQNIKEISISTASIEDFKI